MVAQRNGAIACLKDEVCTQWASGWLPFQRKAASAYLGLDLNFDIPSDKEAEGSLSVDCYGEPDTPTKARSPSSDALTSLYNFACFLFTPGFQPEIRATFLSIKTPFFITLFLPFFLFFFISFLLRP